MEEPKGEEKVGEAEEEYYEAEQQEESWEDDGSWADEEHWYGEFTIEEVPSVREVNSWTLPQGALRSEGSGMLDSGASRTVCGSSWLTRWLHPTLFQDKVNSSAKTFRFGDGRLVKSMGSVKIDAEAQYQNGLRRWIIHTVVIPGNLPLLISMQCMKLLGWCLDLKTRN